MVKEEVWIDSESDIVINKWFVDEALAFREWVESNHPLVLEEYKKSKK